MLSNPTVVSLQERVKVETEQIVKANKPLEYKPAKLESSEFGGCCLVNSSFCMRSKDEGIQSFLVTLVHTAMLILPNRRKCWGRSNYWVRKSNSYRYKVSKPTSTIGLQKVLKAAKSPKLTDDVKGSRMKSFDLHVARLGWKDSKSHEV